VADGIATGNKTTNNQPVELGSQWHCHREQKTQSTYVASYKLACGTCGPVVANKKQQSTCVTKKTDLAIKVLSL